MIVAAANSTHPDHWQALAEVAAWWGREIAPSELGLVPFDPISVGEQLQALDLADCPPVPRRVGEKLASLLLRVGDLDAERQLRPPPRWCGHHGAPDTPDTVGDGGS